MTTKQKPQVKSGIALFELAKWLRHNHDIHITTQYCSAGWYWNIKYMDSELFRMSTEWYDTHDEAYDAAIRFAIKELQSKNIVTQATTILPLEDVEDALLKEIKLLSKHSNIGVNTLMRHLDIDSLDRTTILIVLERTYNVNLAEIVQLPYNATIKDMAAIIHQVIIKQYVSD